VPYVSCFRSGLRRARNVSVAKVLPLKVLSKAPAVVGKSADKVTPVTITEPDGSNPTPREVKDAPSSPEPPKKVAAVNTPALFK
jgi:hypothetical protein